MRRKVGCILGIHHPQNKDGTIELYKINNNCFQVIEKCSDCGEYVPVGTINTSKIDIDTWNFKILND